MSSGLLLALPLESVALRLALALGVALALLRIVSSWDLRSPRARSVLAVGPFVVAAAVVLLSSRDLGLPTVLVPAGAGSGSLALPVADRYLDFAPMAPVLVTAWAAFSMALIGRRAVRASRFRREMLSVAKPAGPRVAASVLNLSRSMGITPPRVLVVPEGLDGAAVVGVRDALLLIDADVLDGLDAHELEGVLAHELAHVARRDNLVAWAVSVVRDIAFFVPGASWAVRALHREREAAADHDAVSITGRPGALASGLLRVLELARSGRQVPHGCAALVPHTSVVDRVELLLREDRPTAQEHRVELALAAAVSLVAVAVAVVVPSMLTGERGERDAIGVLVGAAGEPTQSVVATTRQDGRVFAVYRSVAPVHGDIPAREAASVRTFDLIGPEDRPGMADTCAAAASSCVSRSGPGRLALRPAPIVLIDEPVATRWQATPVSETVAGDRFGVYWLARVDGARLR